MHIIQVTNKNAPGECGQSIVAPSVEWAETNLGGEWVEMPDPINQDPDDPRRYSGPGRKYDPGVVEKFLYQEWNSDHATQMQPDGQGGYMWVYNTQGMLVWHEGRAWRNLLPTGNPNTFPPPTNWREYPLTPEGIPIWIQPSGAYDAYPLDFVVSHIGASYRSKISANTTTPGEDPLDQWWEPLG